MNATNGGGFARLIAIVALVSACGRPAARCTGDETAYCDDVSCVPLCADGDLRETCTPDGCAWVDGTESGPTEVLCFTVEDAPNEIACRVPSQSPICACPEP